MQKELKKKQELDKANKLEEEKKKVCHLLLTMKLFRIYIKNIISM